MLNLTLNLSQIRLSETPTPTTSFSAFTQTPPLTATFFKISTTSQSIHIKTPFTTSISPREHILDWSHKSSEHIPNFPALQTISLTILALRPRTQGCIPFHSTRKPREIGSLRIPLAQITTGTACQSRVLQKPDGRGGTINGPLTISFNLTVDLACQTYISLTDISFRPSSQPPSSAYLSLAAPDASSQRTDDSHLDDSATSLVWHSIPQLVVSASSFLKLMRTILHVTIHATDEHSLPIPLHQISACLLINATMNLRIPFPNGLLSCTVSANGPAPFGQMVGGVTTDGGIVGARPVVFGAPLPKFRQTVRGLPDGWLRLVDTFGYTYYHHVMSGVNVWTPPVRSTVDSLEKDAIAAQAEGYIRGKHSVFRRQHQEEEESDTWIHPAASRLSVPSFSGEAGIVDSERDGLLERVDLRQDSPPSSLSFLDLSGLHPAAFTRADPGPSTATSSARTSKDTEKPTGVVVEMRWKHLAELFSRSGEGTEGHTLTAVSNGTGLLKFGGAFGAGGRRSNNLHRFDVASRSWRVLSPSGVPPAPRTGHGAVAVGSDRSRLLIFGGSSPQGRRNDLHMFHVQDQTWSPVTCSGTPPGIRSRLGMAASSDGGTAIVFGGRSLYRYLGGKYYDPLHLHAFHAERAEWVQLVPQGSSKRPAPRSGCVVELINNRQLFVHGGYDDGDRFFDDTFIFDLASSSWQDLPYPDDPTRPSAREGHCSAVMSDQIIIYGGDSRDGLQNDLHQFDTKRLRWIRSPSLVGHGPGKMTDSAMAVGRDGVAVLVGGDTGFSMAKGTYTLEVSQRSEVGAEELKEMVIERGPDAKLCVVCLDAKVDAMFLWCGHTVCCRACARRVKEACPICRQPFSDVVYGIGA